MLQGLLSADPDAAALMRSMGASKWRIFLSLRVPTALPGAITGLRIMTSFIVVAAIFSEYVGARAGLGIFMQTQKNLYRTDLVFAAVFVSIAIGLTLFALTYLLEWLLLPWERRRKAAQR
jgi:ABC-type nitrate/sulfonate/bicarbonate transport system permease component